MFLIDYHMHSKYSFDGKEEIEDLVKKAKEQGIAEIAVTDHFEFGADMKCNWEQMEKSISEEIEQVDKGKLSVLKGMELGNAHLELEKANKRSRAFQGDFIIGSVHNTKMLEDVIYYDYREIDCNSFYGEYLASVLEIAKYSDYDVIGHITYPFKAMYEQTRRLPDFQLYKKPLEEIFSVLAERKKGIEVNTSGLRVALGDILPERRILELYKKCGGKYITLGSDSHTKEDVGSGIGYAAKQLYELGFEQITTYRKREPIQKNLIK